MYIVTGNKYVLNRKLLDVCQKVDGYIWVRHRYF